MIVLSAEQVRAWDQFTIEQEPISSIDLMERAAKQCVQWITEKQWKEKQFLVFCGSGNNGGDGLAISRLLLEKNYLVTVYIQTSGNRSSSDFQLNLQRLQQLPSAKLHFVQTEDAFPPVPENAIIIDALLGSGLNKPLEGLAAALANHINRATSTVVSIDLPSGLFVNQSSIGNTIVNATYTLTFQCYKPGLLVQENAPFIGEVQVIDIGLDERFLQPEHSQMEMLDEVIIRKIFKPRKRFAHKGTFGHALLICGSYGKMGAAVLSTKACLYSGAGLTTAAIPRCGYHTMQISAPEAMALVDEEEFFLANLPDDIERFSTIGIGPGIGTKQETQKLLSFVIRRFAQPIIVDADALNCFSLNPAWLSQVPPSSILTPHPKEFDRLFGSHQSDFERIGTAKVAASKYNIIIILKGHHTLIVCPDGRMMYNATGNAGMAKGGSGDVLTGILTSLLAQGYLPFEAAQLGVYIHGWAGDIAAKKYSLEAMLPTHLIESLPKVFLTLEK